MSRFRKALVVVAISASVLAASGCSSKPSLEDYKNALFTSFTAGMTAQDVEGIPEPESYRAFTDCFAEATYEKLSAAGIEAMTSTDVEKLSNISEADQVVLTQASTECQHHMPVVAE